MYSSAFSSVRNNLKEHCDLAVKKNETILVTRKSKGDVVIISLDKYNEMEKEIRNARYLAKINRGFEQVYSGKGTRHELIEE